MPHLKKNNDKLNNDIKRSNQVDRISMESASFESPDAKLLIFRTGEAGKTTIWR